MRKLASRFIWICIFVGIYSSAESTQTISFEDVIEKAIANSYELKISDIDISLSKTIVKEMTSLYYPALNVRFNTEYLKDLAGGISGITAIGNSVLSDNTKYQDSMSLNLSYTLLDFGVRKKRRFLTKKDVGQKKLIYHKNLNDLKLKILELYTEVLLTYKELLSKKKTLLLEQEIFRLKERLFNAGTIGKIEVAEEAIKLVRAMEEVDRLKVMIGMALEDIAFYTRVDYDKEQDGHPQGGSTSGRDVPTKGADYDKELIEPLNFKEEEILQDNIEEKKSIEYQIYNLEIEKKKAELGILRRERFPQFGLYSNYTLYGSNRDNFDKSLEDLRQKNWTVGVVTNIPLFEGFKSINSGGRLKLEISKLTIEREKKIAELRNLYAKTSMTALLYKQEVEIQKDLLKNVQDKTVMIERLNSQQIIDRVVLLSQKIELMNQELEVEKALTNKIFFIKKLNILRESYN